MSGRVCKAQAEVLPQVTKSNRGDDCSIQRVNLFDLHYAEGQTKSSKRFLFLYKNQ